MQKRRNQSALWHELNEASHTGSPASPDTLEGVFASTSPSVLCNFMLEQADGGNEECKKELDRILAAVASRNLCANVPDVHAGSDENQPSDHVARKRMHGSTVKICAKKPSCSATMLSCHSLAARMQRWKNSMAH
jgi:hypothetical protein